MRAGGQFRRAGGDQRAGGRRLARLLDDPPDRGQWNRRLGAAPRLAPEAVEPSRSNRCDHLRTLEALTPRDATSCWPTPSLGSRTVCARTQSRAGVVEARPDVPTPVSPRGSHREPRSDVPPRSSHWGVAQKALLSGSASTMSIGAMVPMSTRAPLLRSALLGEVQRLPLYVAEHDGVNQVAVRFRTLRSARRSLGAGRGRRSPGSWWPGRPAADRRRWRSSAAGACV